MKRTTKMLVMAEVVARFDCMVMTRGHKVQMMMTMVEMMKTSIKMLVMAEVVVRFDVI